MRPARYQRGTMISRRSWSTAARSRSTTSGGSMTSRDRAGRTGRAAGSPSVSTKPGLTVCTEMPRGASSTRERARERELRVLRRGVRPDRDRAGDGDDVDDVGAARRARAGTRASSRPSRGSSTRITCSIRSGVGVEEVAARRDARVVDEQVDPRMALEHARRGRLAPPRGRRRRTPRARPPPTAGARARRRACRAPAARARARRRSRRRRR